MECDLFSQYWFIRKCKLDRNQESCETHVGMNVGTCT